MLRSTVLHEDEVLELRAVIALSRTLWGGPIGKRFFCILDLSRVGTARDKSCTEYNGAADDG